MMLVRLVGWMTRRYRHWQCERAVKIFEREAREAGVTSLVLHFPALMTAED
jgi:hypothetical protein